MANDDPPWEELAAAEAETVRLARLLSNLSRSPRPMRRRRRRAGRLRLAARRRRSAGGAAPRSRAGGSRATPQGDDRLGNADDIATSLDNLIENALEYAPEGSTVTITGGVTATRPSSPSRRRPRESRPRMPRRPSSASSAALRGPSARRHRARSGDRGALTARWGGSASLRPRAEGGTRAEIRLPVAGDENGRRYRPLTFAAVPCGGDADSHDHARAGSGRPARRSRRRTRREPIASGRSRPVWMRCPQPAAGAAAPRRRP